MKEFGFGTVEIWAKGEHIQTLGDLISLGSPAVFVYYPYVSLLFKSGLYTSSPSSFKMSTCVDAPAQFFNLCP